MTIGDVWFAIQGMFNSIANCWGMCLEVGYTIRGGIDYGDVYWNEKILLDLHIWMHMSWKVMLPKFLGLFVVTNS